MAGQIIIDPLGRKITLADRTWHGHIVRGHPEVGDHLRLVLDCLQTPDKILFSRNHISARVYVGKGPRIHLMMVVVANIELGQVLTAYLAKTVRGEVEWP